MNQTSKNEFVTPSFIMGIIAVVLSILLGVTLFLPYVLGSLAMLFALLSKEGTKPMESRALIGFTCGLVALIISTVAFFVGIAFLMNLANEQGSMFGQYWEAFMEAFWTEYNATYY